MLYVDLKSKFKFFVQISLLILFSFGCQDSSENIDGELDKENLDDKISNNDGGAKQVKLTPESTDSNTFNNRDNKKLNNNSVKTDFSLKEANPDNHNENTNNRIDTNRTQSNTSRSANIDIPSNHINNNSMNSSNANENANNTINSSNISNTNTTTNHNPNMNSSVNDVQAAGTSNPLNSNKNNKTNNYNDANKNLNGNEKNLPNKNSNTENNINNNRNNLSNNNKEYSNNVPQVNLHLDSGTGNTNGNNIPNENFEIEQGTGEDKNFIDPIIEEPEDINNLDSSHLQAGKDKNNDDSTKNKSGLIGKLKSWVDKRKKKKKKPSKKAANTNNRDEEKRIKHEIKERENSEDVQIAQEPKIHIVKKIDFEYEVLVNKNNNKKKLYAIFKIELLEDIFESINFAKSKIFNTSSFKILGVAFKEFEGIDECIPLTRKGISLDSMKDNFNIFNRNIYVIFELDKKVDYKLDLNLEFVLLNEEGEEYQVNNSLKRQVTKANVKKISEEIKKLKEQKKKNKAPKKKGFFKKKVNNIKDYFQDNKKPEVAKKKQKTLIKDHSRGQVTINNKNYYRIVYEIDKSYASKLDLENSQIFNNSTVKIFNPNNMVSEKDYVLFASISNDFKSVIGESFKEIEKHRQVNDSNNNIFNFQQPENKKYFLKYLCLKNNSYKYLIVYLPIEPDFNIIHMRLKIDFTFKQLITYNNKDTNSLPFKFSLDINCSSSPPSSPQNLNSSGNVNNNNTNNNNRYNSGNNQNRNNNNSNNPNLNNNNNNSNRNRPNNQNGNNNNNAYRNNNNNNTNNVNSNNNNNSNRNRPNNQNGNNNNSNTARTNNRNSNNNNNAYRNNNNNNTNNVNPNNNNNSNRNRPNNQNGNNNNSNTNRTNNQNSNINNDSVNEKNTNNINMSTDGKYNSNTPEEVDDEKEDVLEGDTKKTKNTSDVIYIEKVIKISKIKYTYYYFSVNNELTEYLKTYYNSYKDFKIILKTFNPKNIEVSAYAFSKKIGDSKKYKKISTGGIVREGGTDIKTIIKGSLLDSDQLQFQVKLVKNYTGIVFFSLKFKFRNDEKSLKVQLNV